MSPLPGADKLDMSTWFTMQSQLTPGSGEVAGNRRAQSRFLPALWVMQQLVLQRGPYADRRFAKVQWISLVDDDAYILYANLRMVLNEHDVSSPIYTGHVSPDAWLPDHVDGCNIELGVATNTSFVAGGPGSYFNKRALEMTDLVPCLRKSLPGGELDAWQSDWMVARCLTAHGIQPKVSGSGSSFVQFACNVDGAVLPCEISASSEDPETFDEKPAGLHPIKTLAHMLYLQKEFNSSAEQTFSGSAVRERLWSAANQLWRDEAILRREIRKERARSGRAQNQTSLQSVTTLYATDATPWDAFGASLYFEDDLMMTGACSENVDNVSNAGAVYIYKAPTRRSLVDGKLNQTEWTLQCKLTAPTPTENAYFGSSVAMHRNTIVVGAYGEAYEGVRHVGAVYVYERNLAREDQWDLVTRLQFSHRKVAGTTQLLLVENLYFGQYVSVHDDDIVVGCPYARTCSDGAVCDGGAEAGTEAAGAVVTYSRQSTGWEQTGTLTLPGMAAYDFFGKTVFVTSTEKGEWLIAAAYGRDVEGVVDAGAVYAYSRSHKGWAASASDSPWVLRQEMTAHGRAENAFFGISLVGNSDGDTLVIGAAGEGEGGFDNAGAAYVFTLNESKLWTEQTRLAPKEPRDRGGFGQSVTMYSDSIMISTKGLVDTAHSGHSNGSAITLFRLGLESGKWEFRTQVEDPHAFGSHFGYSVSMRGLATAVSAPFTKSGSMASWIEGTLASRPDSKELLVHGAVMVLEEEPAVQPTLDNDGCWNTSDGSQAGCFPQVFLLGAQKAATTSLFKLVHTIGMGCPANNLLSGVRRTANTQNSVTKQADTRGREAHTFDLLDARASFLRDPALLSKMYDLRQAPECRRRWWDATPNYLSSENAVQQMLQVMPQALLPKTRLIVILREPIARDVSWFNHRLRYLSSRHQVGLMGMELCGSDAQTIGTQNLSYAAEVDCNLKLLEACIGVLGNSNASLQANFTACLQRPKLLAYRGNSLVDGLYAAHIHMWTKAFPRQNMLVLSHEHITSSPAATTETLHAIGEFLQVWTPPGTFTLPEINTASSAESGTVVLKIGCSAKRRLQQLYNPWNELLFERLRRDHHEGTAPKSERFFDQFEDEVACSLDDVEENSTPMGGAFLLLYVLAPMLVLGAACIVVFVRRRICCRSAKPAPVELKLVTSWNSEKAPTLDYLQGLRFLAILWVITLHAQAGLMYDSKHNEDPITRVVQRAAVAVSFFVVLSGFVTEWTSPTFNVFSRPVCSMRQLLVYYTNRLAKVMLVLFITNVLCYICKPALFNQLVEAGPSTAIFVTSMCTLGLYPTFQPVMLVVRDMELIEVNNYNVMPRCPNISAWTVEALVPLWLLFPILQSLLPRLLKSMWLWLLILALSLLYIGILLGLFFSQDSTLSEEQLGNLQVRSYSWLPEFICGMLAAELARRHWQKGASEPGAQADSRFLDPASWGRVATWQRMASTVLPDVVLLSIMIVTAAVPAHLMMMCGEGQTKQCTSFWQHGLSGLVAVYICLSATAARGVGVFAWCMQLRPLVALGNVSMEAYLLHMPLILLSQTLSEMIAPEQAKALQQVASTDSAGIDGATPVDEWIKCAHALEPCPSEPMTCCLHAHHHTLALGRESYWHFFLYCVPYHAVLWPTAWALNRWVVTPFGKSLRRRLTRTSEAAPPTDSPPSDERTSKAL